MRHKVHELAALVGGEVLGDGEREVAGVATLERAGPTDVGFVRDASYRRLAVASAAGLIVVPEDLGLESAAQLVVADVATAFARIAQAIHPRDRAVEHDIHPTAAVHPEATLIPPVRIGAQAVVERGARIGAGSIVGAGTVVGAGVAVGEDVVLHPRVVLYPGVVLGDRVTVHSGTVLGADGFGYANHGGSWVRVPQVGGLVVGDDVDFGANCAVDGGTLAPTEVRRGAKLDNMIHVGHNCVIGEDNALAAGTALAGSTVLGANCTLGGRVVSAGHVEVAAGTRIGGNSVILRSVPEAGDYMGYPLMEKRQWMRMLPTLRNLVSRRRGQRRDTPLPD